VESRTPERISPLDNRLISLSLSENITELLQWRSDELGLLPKIWGQVTVSVADSDESGLESVLKGLGGTGGGSVDIINTSKLEKTLDSWGSDETSTAWSWDKLNDTLADTHPRETMLRTLTETEPHLPLSLVGRE
jgi:hypothetical protein